MKEKLLRQFRELVIERLKRVGGFLMELEHGANGEISRTVLRELHSLKGEARMMGFSEVNKLVHAMEDLVRAAASSDMALSGAAADALLASSDAVQTFAGVRVGPPPDLGKLLRWMNGQLELTGSDPPAKSPDVRLGEPAAPVNDALSAPVRLSPSAAAPRVDMRRNDGVRIGQQSLELLTSSVNNLTQLARRRARLADHEHELVNELKALARAAEALGPEGAEVAARASRAKELMAELRRRSRLLANEEMRDLGQVSEEVQQLRMSPLSVLFEPYPRMVRDLARELGKDVVLHVDGEDTRADRAVLEAVREPLLHLVRNALDHGLETSAQRIAAGKPPKGQLVMRARREGERLVVRVEDDGVGLEGNMLRRAAVRQGLLDEREAASLDDAGAHELIFQPGFSSKETASDLSGRGVGLDVVRVGLQQLGGEVTVQSTVGHGARFELRAPVSLTMAPLLFLRVGAEQLCLTAAHVASALRVESSQLLALAGRHALRVRDEVLPFASTQALLGLSVPRPPHEGELVLLVRGQGSAAALAVDGVLEERVQAILPLKGMLSRFKHLAGATPLSDGSLALVLSAVHLIALARGGEAHLPRVGTKNASAKRRILVVDDSPLTRELLSSLLDAIGFETVSAPNGTAALDKLRSESVDLVVTDLEMPRMGGLELTRRLKEHPTLRKVPVIIVTTRGGEADRQSGIEAGADGYVTKGDLMRQDLVDVVTRLLG